MQLSNKAVTTLVLALGFPLILIGTGYYFLHYVGFECFSETSPDGRYIVEGRASFRPVTAPGDGGCHQGAGSIRLRTSQGKVVQRVFTDSLRETEVYWDDLYDVVEVKYSLFGVNSIHWLLDHPTSKPLPPFYLQHRLNLMVDNGDITQVRRVLKQRANINAVDDAGKLPLVKATYNQDIRMIKYLLAHGALVNNSDDNGDTALHWSQTSNVSGNVVSPVTKLLVDRGADVNAQNNYGQTPLHTGIRSLAEVMYLIDHGANINAVDNEGKSPIAAYSSDFAVIQYLVNQGAQIDYRSTWVPPFLYRAILHGNVELIRSFESNGADISAALAIRDGIYPLHFAASAGKLSMVTYLVEHHTDINEKDQEGKTPLQLVKRELNGNFSEGSECETLKAVGANVDCNHRQKLNEVANYLIKHGAQ